MFMEKFIKVDAKHYVVTGLQSGDLVPFRAVKDGKVLARRGKVGEEVITYTAGGLVEKVDTVKIDPDTGNPEWVVMKANEHGYPVVDEYGHVNEWIRDDSDFLADYVPDKEIDGVYESIDGSQVFVPVLMDMILIQDGEEMAVEAGGYLNITDITNIYAISKRDFDDTYRIIDEVNMKKAI
jgi:hypothetical protein